MNNAQELEKANAELRRTIELLDFARFGFKGTLFAGVCGMVFILSLAVLEALTDFVIGPLGLIGLALVVLAGAIAFGYFSLRHLPKVELDIKNQRLAIDRSQGKATD